MYRLEGRPCWLANTDPVSLKSTLYFFKSLEKQIKCNLIILSHNRFQKQLTLIQHHPGGLLVTRKDFPIGNVAPEILIFLLVAPQILFGKPSKEFMKYWKLCFFTEKITNSRFGKPDPRNKRLVDVLQCVRKQTFKIHI